MTGTVSAAVPDIIRDAREDWREPLADRRESAVCQESIESSALGSNGSSGNIETAADSGGICGGWPEIADLDRDGFPESRARGARKGFLLRIGDFFDIFDVGTQSATNKFHQKN